MWGDGMKWVNSISELFRQSTIDLDRVKYFQDNNLLSISITMRCSLRCPYCVSNMFNPRSQRDNFIDKMGIQSFIDKLYTCFHHKFPMQTSIPGTGEPTESPHFVPLFSKLLEWENTVIIQTNLNGSKRIEEVLSSYSKKEVHDRVKIVTSYHLGTMLDRPLQEGYDLRSKYLCEHFPRIVDLGCNVVQVVTPMTPKAIRDDRIINDFEFLYKLHAFQPVVTELYHFYQGKTYPRDYTPEDRNLLQEVRAKIFDVCQYHPQTFHDVPNKDQVKYNTAAFKLKGMSCYKPTYHLDILATGELRICQTEPPWILGQFETIDPDFVKTVFHDEPVKCPAEKCLCRSAGISGCLSVHGITTNEYYYAHYMENHQPQIAKLFQKTEKTPRIQEEVDSL